MLVIIPLLLITGLEDIVEDFAVELSIYTPDIVLFLFYSRFRLEFDLCFQYYVDLCWQ